MSREFKTSSGAEVVVNVADWDSSVDLHDAVFSEGSLMKLEIDFGFLKGKSLGDVEVADILGVIFRDVAPVVLRLASSKEVRRALFACFARCTYNGEKITMKTFTPEESRGDYYEIAEEVMKANLSPFFKNLLSRLIKLKDIPLKNLKSPASV